MVAPEPCSELLVPELVAFLHAGVAAFVGTSSRDLVPAMTRGFAPRVAADRRTFDVFVGLAHSAVCLENLGPQRAIALTAGSVVDYRGVQIKGVCAGWQAASAADHAWVEDYWKAFLVNCATLGHPPEVIAGLRCRELVRVTVVPTAIFRQTPGPGAGGAVEGGARWA